MAIVAEVGHHDRMGARQQARQSKLSRRVGDGSRKRLGLRQPDVRVRQRTALLSAPNDSGQPAPPRSPTDGRAEDVRPLRRLDVVNGVPVEQTPKQGLRRRILGDAGGPAVRYEARIVHETDIGRGGGLLQGLP